MPQLSNEEMLRLAGRRFRKHFDHTLAYADVYSLMSSLPALAGGWIGSYDRATPTLLDVSQNGLDMTFNGASAITSSGMMTYLSLSSTGYLTRADESLLDFSGTEANIAEPGFSFMCWVNITTVTGAQRSVMSKYDTSANRSYQLHVTSTGALVFTLSDDGTTTYTVTSSAGDVTAGVWYFLACRYKTEEEMKIWVDFNTTTETGSVPASIFNSTAQFSLGSQNGSFVLNGSMAYPCLYACALSDVQIETFAAMTSPLPSKRL